MDFDSAAVQSRDNDASDQIAGEQSGVDNSNGRQQGTDLSKEHIAPARRCSHADELCAMPMVRATYVFPLPLYTLACGQQMQQA
ncbi:MAG: hypothetical protein WCB44_20315 [Stellaceae bacterium]